MSRFVPEPGHILWCRFPLKERIGPGVKPRPVLVVSVMEERSPPWLRIAYGTSRGTFRNAPWEFVIDESTPEAFEVSGLSRATKISLRHVVVVPFTSQWFPPAPRWESCVLGVLHSGLMKSAQRAAQAARLI